MSEQEIQRRQQVLVEKLKEKKIITSPTVEQAFLSVPRSLFIPGYPLDEVYSPEKAIVFRQNEQGMPTSSCSAPDMMAIMLEMLDLRPGQTVMEIGAATGYNAALIGAVVGPRGRVVTIDIQADLVESARRRLDSAGFGWVKTLAADGGYGYPDWAPFDRIILTVCPWVIAPAWREQLKEGGRLVLPLDLGPLQQVVSFVRQGDELVSTETSMCAFMPIQGDYSRRQQPNVRAQVGPDPRLVMTSEKELPGMAERIAGWLKEPFADYPSGVKATRGEILTGLFPWWIGTSEFAGDRMVGLQAEGELAWQDVIPALIGWGGAWQMAATGVAPGEDGCALLMRPPGHVTPLMEFDKPDQDAQPFEIYVREFGRGDDAAQMLLRQIWRWQQAGRPDLTRISLRAVPTGHPVTLTAGEHLWERPWTNLVVKFL